MLYSLSDELKNKVLDRAKEVENCFYNSVKFDEYIVLPDYGEKIIIRFRLTEDDKTLEELDEMECKIRSIIGNDYWGNLIGSYYKRFGFDSKGMQKSLLDISSTVEDKVICYNETSYRQHIIKDKKIIGDVWVTVAIVDYIRVFSNFKKPVFTTAETYDYGGSGTYKGLGYSFDIEGNFLPEDDPKGVTQAKFYLFGKLIKESNRD